MERQAKVGCVATGKVWGWLWLVKLVELKVDYRIVVWPDWLGCVVNGRALVNLGYSEFTSCAGNGKWVEFVGFCWGLLGLVEGNNTGLLDRSENWMVGSWSEDGWQLVDFDYTGFTNCAVNGEAGQSGLCCNRKGLGLTLVGETGGTKSGQLDSGVTCMAGMYSKWQGSG
jgi:hypothetical protein